MIGWSRSEGGCCRAARLRFYPDIRCSKFRICLAKCHELRALKASVTANPHCAPPSKNPYAGQPNPSPGAPDASAASPIPARLSIASRRPFVAFQGMWKPLHPLHPLHRIWVGLGNGRCVGPESNRCESTIRFFLAGGHKR